MLLGKQINMWGINDKTIFNIGEFGTCVNLAIEAMDKAPKIRDWIDEFRVVKTDSVKAILSSILVLDILSLKGLRTQVRGIDSARTDILTGWTGGLIGGRVNDGRRRTPSKGSSAPFSGLFTPDEIESQMTGHNMNAISFAFFRQLSVTTKVPWARLVLSTGDTRGVGLDAGFGPSQPAHDYWLLCWRRPTRAFGAAGGGGFWRAHQR
ncbi:hypothetical protein MFIFM68171_04901 [Madurella fahalii]|uniref:Uncharacterized protein n=1 Tax=Madurella fahalii TaxID=1157608 RepID=A0ABQ0GAD1_9PEZI